MKGNFEILFMDRCPFAYGRFFPATTFFCCSPSFLGFWIYACEYLKFTYLHGLPDIPIWGSESLRFSTKKMFWTFCHAWENLGIFLRWTWMGSSLFLWDSATPLKGRGLTVLLWVRRDTGPAQGKGCIFSLTELCTLCTAELFSTSSDVYSAQ